MPDIQKTVDILHELILVNNDRVKWYEKAGAEIHDKDATLEALFYEYAEESRLYAKELDEKIKVLGSADGIDSTSLAGKVFRVWSDVSRVFSGNPVVSVLASSENVEDRIQQAYLDALKDETFMDQSSILLLEQQQMVLKDMHDEIKNYRDASTPG